MQEHRGRVLVEPISVRSVRRSDSRSRASSRWCSWPCSPRSPAVGSAPSRRSTRPSGSPIVSRVGIVAPLLDDDLVHDGPRGLDRVDAAVREFVLQGSLVRVKIWREDGTIVYSDEPRLIGQQFDARRRRTGRFWPSGEQVRRGERPVEAREPVRDRVEAARGVLAAETPSGTPLLFEAYFRYSGVTDVGRQLWAQFAPITIGALIVLELDPDPAGVVDGASPAMRANSNTSACSASARCLRRRAAPDRQRPPRRRRPGADRRVAGARGAGPQRVRRPAAGPRCVGCDPLQHQVAAVAAGRDLPAEPPGGGTRVGGRRPAQRAHRARDRDRLDADLDDDRRRS